MSKLSIETEDKLAVIYGALEYCQTIYMDGMIVVPVQLSSNEETLSIVDRGVRKVIVVSAHNFEGEL